jgi:hypothetical protein
MVIKRFVNQKNRIFYYFFYFIGGEYGATECSFGDEQSLCKIVDDTCADTWANFSFQD